jgi:hypothetical protein
MIKAFFTMLSMVVFFTSISASFYGVRAGDDGKGPANKWREPYTYSPDHFKIDSR